ncbi:MAG: glycosyltransferase family 39 protein [Terracidiphilus sp.]
MPFRLKKLNQPRAVYWFAALGFVLRIAARLWYTGIEGFWMYGYGFFFDLAQSIAQGRGFSQGGAPTAFRVPMYSIVLAGITLGHRAFWPIAIAQSAMGAATAIGAGVLARRMFAGPAANRAATLAAAVTAVYPYYVIHDTAMQETCLFTLLTLAAVLVLGEAARAGKAATGAMAGVVLGLDVLTRATIAPFAVLAPLWLLWRRRRWAAAACALLVAGTVAPWIVRNAVVMGTATLSTETGIEFWAGNCGFLFRHYPQESSDVSKTEATESLPPEDRKELEAIGDNEVLQNRWYFRKGLEYVRAHPGQTVIDGIRKNLAAFSWLPSPRRGWADDLVHAISYGPVMLVGLWGMGRRRSHWHEDSIVYLVLATFMVVTAVFWAHTSHRAYLDVYWIVFAAGALAETVLRRRDRRTAGAQAGPATAACS